MVEGEWKVSGKECEWKVNGEGIESEWKASKKDSDMGYVSKKKTF
jgi:hypothetical protein